MSKSLATFRRRGTAVAVAALAVVLSLPLPASSSRGFESAGTLARIPADVRALFPDAVPQAFDVRPRTATARNNDFRNASNGTMLVFPEVRQLWQIYYLETNETGRTAVVVRDLDTMAIRHSFVLLTPPSRLLHTSRAGEWIHAVDPGKRVFLLTNDQQDILEVDLKTFATKQYRFSATDPIAGRFSGARLGGLSYDPYGDALLGLFSHMSGTYVANVNTFLLRRDLRSGKVDPPRHIRACNASLPATETGTTLLLPILVRPEAIFVPCQRAGATSTVVRLDRKTATDPTTDEELAIGPVSLETALADDASGRLFLITTTGEIWAFDTASMSFLGVIPAFGEMTGQVSPNLGYGIDRQTGRLFFQSPTYGLGVVEGRFFPLPQARILASAKDIGQERIWSDPATNRLFVLPGYGLAKGHEYHVYKLDPAPAPPPPTDPDRNTLDTDEQPGVTDRTFFGSATGYGARVLLANGVSTVAPAPTVGVFAPTAMALRKYFVSRCGFNDRELVAGSVTRAAYDTGSAAASAVAVGVDPGTKLDLEKPSRCDLTVKDGKAEIFKGIFSTAPAVLDDPAEERWQVKAAECSASTEGDTEEDAAVDDGHTRLGTSKVTCPNGEGKLEASATATLVGPVSVGSAVSSVKIAPGKGEVVSTVESIARDIGIAGVIQIAEVRSRATSKSTGRPSATPMSDHAVEIKGLTIEGVPICGVCDSQTAVAALNRAAAGRAQFRVAGGLDPALLRGSPKGALTAVQKSAQRQASDQALVGDFTLDVPGLEMIVYNDNIEWGRARQLYQFAGVASSATYNITLLPTGAGFDDEGSDGGEIGALDDLAGEGSSSADAPSADADRPGIIERVLDAAGDAVTAVARGFRFLLTNRREALLIATAWATLGLPYVLARRRSALTAL